MTSNAIEAGSLRVEFFRVGDRFAHRVMIVDAAGYPLAGGEALVAESIEGSADEAWPQSPALQELHREAGPDGRPRLLLVGMSGASHWSMSVEAVDETSIVFDVACRGRGFPPRVGSAYRWPASGSVNAASLRSSVEDHAHALSVEPDEGIELRVKSNVVRVERVVAPSESPQTVRWKYKFTIC